MAPLASDGGKGVAADTNVDATLSTAARLGA